MKKFFQITALLTGLFLVFFLQLKYSPEFTECLTANYCISSHENILILTLVYGFSVIIMLIAALVTLYFMLIALKKGYVYHVGGTTMLIIGIGGIIALFATTPAEQINEYLHIIGISTFSIVFGAIMLILGLKGHGKFN